MSQLTFHYRAIDRSGLSIRGSMQALDQNEAYRQLAAAGMQPVRLRAGRALKRRARVTRRDLAQLSYQLGVLLEARIPLVDGLRSIGEQEGNHQLGAVLEHMAREVEGGRTLTSALESHRELFGDVFVESVHAAEKSGNLITALNALAEMYEREEEMAKTARGALVYPACVVAALGLALLFLMTTVVPKFATMFASRGVELPLPTRLLMAISHGLGLIWPLLLIGGVGLVWWLRVAWRAPSQRAQLDRWLHRVPYLRDMLKGLAISRFAQVFGISLRSGLSLLDALQLAGRASGRPLLEADAATMRHRVSGGGRLTDVLGTCSYLTPFTKRMLSAGEEAAELTKMCEIVSRHYDREVTHLAKNISTIIEPILIVGLAAVVLVIALAIFLPLWNMGSLVG